MIVANVVPRPPRDTYTRTSSVRKEQSVHKLKELEHAPYLITTHAGTKAAQEAEEEAKAAKEEEARLLKQEEAARRSRKLRVVGSSKRVVGEPHVGEQQQQHVGGEQRVGCEQRVVCEHERVGGGQPGGGSSEQRRKRGEEDAQGSAEPPALAPPHV